MKSFFFLVLSFLLLISEANCKVTTRYVSLPNIELSALRQATRLHPVASQKKIDFTIWLQLRNQAKLTHLVNELYDAQSAHYQKFLTFEQFHSEFSPNQEMIDAIINYFSRQGMSVKQTYSTLQVTGTAKQIEQSLRTHLAYYRVNGKLVYGNTSAPKLPSEIAQYIAAISGLSNVSYTHPNYLQAPKGENHFEQFTTQPLNLIWGSFLPYALPSLQSLQGFTGEQLQIAYNLANIPPVQGVSIDGTGQTIVIIDGCGYNSVADIINYSNQYNQINNFPMLTASNFNVVNYDGSLYSDVCANPSAWDSEILLDIQASHTIAPGANILLVLTDNVRNDQVAYTLDYLMSHNFTMGGFSNAYVVSNSWDNIDESQNEPLESVLMAAAAEGMSINFAAGDCGDQTYQSSWSCYILSPTPSIQYPVSSAYVTAVAGTSLFVDSNWNYAFESGWGTLLHHAFYSGSMGGISQYQQLPVWQGVISNFIAGGYSAGTVGQYNKRAIPDIAMLADVFTGLLTYSNGCSPCYEGGASLATPLFSGTLALVNQARFLNKGQPNPLGLASPYFYSENGPLLRSQALHLITPPHQIISGAQPVSGGPLSAFEIFDPFFGDTIGFNWDSSLTIVENQFWNDVVGVGSPNIPNFVQIMASL